MGKLFVSQEWNIRQQVSSSQNKGTALSGVRYATQYDFDKFCFNNPYFDLIFDDRFSFDWNAEVYKVFVSSTPGTYTSATQNERP